MKSVIPMIKFLAVAMFAFLLTANIFFVPFVQAQEHDPQPEIFQIQKLDFLDKFNGWVLLGDQLFWTRDAGSTWIPITPALPKKSMIWDVQFLDTNKGWFLYSSERLETTGLTGDLSWHIAHTEDQGQSWTFTEILDLPSKTIAPIANAWIFWTDSKHGWISLKYSGGVNFSAGDLIHTNDGGLTWVAMDSPIGAQAQFTSSSFGWMSDIDSEQVFVTSNAGSTWQEIFFDTPNDQFQSSFLASVHFRSLDNGQLLRVLYSHDKENASIQYFSFHEEMNSWKLVDEFPITYKTGIFPYSVTSDHKIIVILPDDSRMLQLSIGDSAFITNYDNTLGKISIVDMVSENIGWAIWNDSLCTKNDLKDDVVCTTKQKLVYTNDGGKFWAIVSMPNGQSILENTTSYPLSDSYPETTNRLNLGESEARSLASSQLIVGQGFDKCEIPTTAQLQKWFTGSPYAAVNLYGGSCRGCGNSALTKSYITQIYQQGWKFIPTWVGPQSACWTGGSCSARINSNSTNAYNQGVSEAELAIAYFESLGFNNSVIYYDLEGYPTNTSCQAAAKSFMDGWVKQLRSRGWTAGVYGSSCASHLTDFYSIANRPDVIWPAATYTSYYDPDATTSVPCITSSQWANHQRIRQYTPGHNETWGGVTLNIDSNKIDGVVAVPNITQVRDAQFVSQNIPTSMSAGQIYEVSITFKNIGSTSWSKSTNFKLGSQNPRDNFTWGIQRVNLSDTDLITTGQSKTFTFNVVAPSTPGSYNFQWQILQEDIGWFGDLSTNIVVNVTSSNTIIVNPPALTPLYTGDMCVTAWHKIAGYNGKDAFLTLNTNISSQSTNSAVWQPTIAVAGNYKIEAYIPVHGVITWQCPTKTISGDTSDARYTIYHASGTTTISRDQLPLSNAWMDLGTYTLNIGSDGKVVLKDLNGEANLSRTISFSAVRFTLITPNSPGAFNKISPTNGAINQSTGTTLQWGLSSGATSYDYCYDTTNDNSCSTWIPTGTATSANLSGLTANTTYYWHVRASNTGGTTYANGTSTAFWSFTTAGTPSTPPGLFNKTSPVNGATGQATNLTVQWSASSGTASYEYCYDATNDNACSNWVSAGTNTSISLTGLATNTTYYWHVRANNAVGTTYANGSRTAFWSFTTGSVITTATFSDVPVTYWAWSFIERLYNAGITGGCATTPNLLYCPDATVTRAQMAVFLLKSMHGAGFTPPLVGDSTGFGDVATSHWAAPWIKQLALEGITGGCGNGNYCPEAPVTRAQMAVFLLKAKNGSGFAPPVIGDGSGFTDVPDNYWAAVWIKQLAADGITGGCGAGVYCPESPVTRAQMAVFIVKTFGLP